MVFRIAIDGPAGAGKSIVSKLVADKMGILCVDTGAMYRACALYCIKNGIDVNNEEIVTSVLDKINVRLDNNKTYLNDEDVSLKIRTEEVSTKSSIVAKQLKVREKVVDMQRKMADSTSLVMQGRDITSVVLTDAELKIYLTASATERASRRFLELKGKGVDCNLEEILQNIEERDMQDITRKISPLVKTEDSVLLDTTNMTIEEVVDRIIELAKERGFKES